MITTGKMQRRALSASTWRAAAARARLFCCEQRAHGRRRLRVAACGGEWRREGERASERSEMIARSKTACASLQRFLVWSSERRRRRRRAMSSPHACSLAWTPQMNAASARLRVPSARRTRRRSQANARRCFVCGCSVCSGRSKARRQFSADVATGVYIGGGDDSFAACCSLTGRGGGNGERDERASGRTAFVCGGGGVNSGSSKCKCGGGATSLRATSEASTTNRRRCRLSLIDGKVDSR